MCKLHTKVKEIGYPHNGEDLVCGVFVRWYVKDGSVTVDACSLESVCSGTTYYADLSWEECRPLSDLEFLAELKADVLERVTRSCEEGDDYDDCLQKGGEL